MRARSASAEERLSRLQHLQKLTAELARQIGPATEVGDVLQAVLDAMRSLVEFKGGSVQLIEDGALYIAASDPPVSPEVLAARLPLGTGLGGRVVTSGEPVYSADIGSDPRVDPALRRLGSNAPMTSYLGVPLVCLGEVIGVMQVDSHDADAFDDDDLQVLTTLASHVAGAIEGARRAQKTRELEKLKTDFLTNVSHQLRTPLTIISGFVTTLRNYPGQLDLEQQTQMLDRIGAAADRLRYLVEEVLTVTQLEAGVVTAQRALVRLEPLLHEVRSQAAEPDLIRLECPTNLEISTDPKLLRLAVGHLVDNAERYAEGCELIADRSPSGEVVVEVRDHGPGLPDGLADRMFEPFERGDPTSVGMGLGLSLVRTVCRALGAHLEVAEPDDGGLLVKMSLPG